MNLSRWSVSPLNVLRRQHCNSQRDGKPHTTPSIHEIDDADRLRQFTATTRPRMLSTPAAPMIRRAGQRAMISRKRKISHFALFL